jgi:inner membrane protein
MDNLAHSLAGAVLGEAGLKRRTALAMPTLLIGANLPDMDALAILVGHGLSFRRGWTHGVLALALLPLFLTAAMLAWDRWVRRRRDAELDPARPAQLLLLAYVAVLSHPLLDWLNNYGMRWLMPFDGTWYYGDALFIVDPWLWLILLGGVVLARRRSAPRPGLIALGLAGAYILLMLVSAAIGRAVVEREVRAMGILPQAVMVGPVPVDPFRRDVVIRDGDLYRFGTLRWDPLPRFELSDRALAANLAHPLAVRAALEPGAERFLRWSRFPFAVIEDGAPLARVRLDDARYSRGAPSWAAVNVELESTRHAGE